ncbi:rhamnogalacturonan acetylesterase [Pseudoblastomonas halimionae]|uniref:Lysophospholipase n=1 Tax=Alteriqipengyuania halimionae TaxID=1926630 RepID=A0A6I4U763_9SPHN|nr:rhamnogalacturonan acetylesterase [Alteriqipengyuania halimionae]MXP10292.1 lysophospholipase [Alteriqipengyuania halimionae]
MTIRDILFSATACALVAASPTAAQNAERATETSAPAKPNKIILVGDSTTATANGWGPAFCSRHVTHPTPCLNLARNGRSSGSFRAEGLWDIARGEMQVEGYDHVFVLIGFAHNDQPGKPGRSTDLETEFPANMRRYVEEARAAGAVPILFTPLTRRQFEDGELDDDLGPWVAAIERVAAETGAPLIDLNGRSRAIIAALGPSLANLTAEAPPSAAIAAAAAIEGETLPSATGRPVLPEEGASDRIDWRNPLFDYTHLGEFGAELFAAVIAAELVRLVPDIRPLVRP